MSEKEHLKELCDRLRLSWRKLAQLGWEEHAMPVRIARDTLEKQQAEIERLKAWKDEAIAAMPPMQEIAKALEIPLGQSIHDKILPGIERLEGDLADALDCKRGDGPTALSMVLAERDELMAEIERLEAKSEWQQRERVCRCGAVMYPCIPVWKCPNCGGKIEGEGE